MKFFEGFGYFEKKKKKTLQRAKETHVLKDDNRICINKNIINIIGKIKSFIYLYIYIHTHT